MKTLAPLSALVLLGLTHVAWAVPVSVQVLGPDKKPVAGAQVRARFWKPTLNLLSMESGDAQSAVSDARGQARFEAPDVPLLAGLRGMIGEAVAWSPALSISSTPLKAGQNTIGLAPGGTAHGVVVDVAGRPVPGALVRLARVAAGEAEASTGGAPVFALDEKMMGEEFSVRTDAAGAWSLRGLPLRGTASVELGEARFARLAASALVAEDSAPWSVEDALLAARARAKAPVVAPGPSPFAKEAGADGALVARPSASLAGRVLDAAGAPLAGATMSVGQGFNDFFARSGEPIKTDAKGEFRAARLAEGEYTVSVLARPEDQGRGVLGAALKVRVGAGADAVAGDIKLVPGGTISMRLLDAATGQGLAGASAFALRPGSMTFDFVPSPPTGPDGKSVMHLAAGNYQVILIAPPEGYLAPEGAGYMDGPKVEVVVGADKAVEWKLSRGIALSGRTVDEKGQPVPNVSLWITAVKPGMEVGRGLTTGDAEGKWSESSFRPGSWKVGVQGDAWKVVGAAEFTLPRQGPLDIVLAPIPRIALSGRVVDAAGTPVPGARVELSISMPGEAYMPPSQRSATTDAAGMWRVETVPETGQKITLVVSRPGFAAQRLPQASKKDGAWAATDAVLQKRDARLAGRVLDAAGQGVAAQVLVSSASALAASDKDGAWSLSELPGGEAEVVAVGAGGAAVATTKAPSESVTLRLKAPQVLGERDVDRAQEILDDAWQTSRGSQYAMRSRIPAVLASADADAALALARGEDKKVAGQVVLEIVRVLLRRGPDHLQEAQAWAQANLGAVEEPFERESLLLLLGSALAGADAPSARKWLAQARTGYAALKEDWQRQQLAPRLAALASRLQEPDAGALFEQALALAGKDARSVSYLDRLATAVAGRSEAWANRIIEAAVAAPAPPNDYAPGPEAVVASAVTRLARTDLPAAQRLLTKYGSLKSKSGWDGQMDQARGEVLGARARAGEDVDALAKEAAGLQLLQSRGLVLIAEGASGAKKIELLKRALDLTQGQSRYGLSLSLGIIRSLLPLDREAARAGLDKARADLEAPRNEADEWNRLRAADVASWAWMYRQFDATAARVMVEREWARGISALPGEQDEWNRWPRLAELVSAMMPLDIERAQQLAERLPVAGANAPAFAAQAAIARWMLASTEERAGKPLSFWSNGQNEDEGRGADA